VVRPVANIGGLEESGGSVTGIVKFTGKQPERKPLASITGNAYCSEHCNGQPPLDEKWVFGKNGSDDTFANVLVYVAKGLEGKKFTPRRRRRSSTRWAACTRRAWSELWWARPSRSATATRRCTTSWRT